MNGYETSARGPAVNGENVAHIVSGPSLPLSQANGKKEGKGWFSGIRRAAGDQSQPALVKSATIPASHPIKASVTSDPSVHSRHNSKIPRATPSHESGAAALTSLESISASMPHTAEHSPSGNAAHKPVVPAAPLSHVSGSAAFMSLESVPFTDLYLRLDESGDIRYLIKFRRQYAESHAASSSNARHTGCLPGMGKGLSAPVLAEMHDLLIMVKARLSQEPEAAVEYKGMRFRASSQTMADGEHWVCMRRINNTILHPDKLGLDPNLLPHLMNLGRRDGLVLVAGPTCNGKTTTAVSLLREYLIQYGGIGFTVEDPVEYNLQGHHGSSGYCFQSEIRGEEDWAEYIKRSLRWSPQYILVGEIRTPRAAEELLRAATTGHLVITTVHAGSIQEALSGILFLAEQAMGKGVETIFANSLTAIIFQQLLPQGLHAKFLVTEEGNTGDPIRAVIREGKLGAVVSYTDRIAARIAAGHQTT
ncbi:MAG: Flp pilus assembly complex ATPase component TadA [Alphaproteobacteria bacterium]|nr:MAG: Flp pilus assembly complex ATPase component TadA [Alphaproteobacteria bacterium]